MSSNMRQRIANKAAGAAGGGAIFPPPGSLTINEKSSWEITPDDGESSSSGAIPMYNPLHYQSSSSAISAAATDGTATADMDMPHHKQKRPPPSSSSSTSPARPNMSWDAVMEAKRKNERLLGSGSLVSSSVASGTPSTTSMQKSYIGMKGGNPLLLPSVTPKFIADKDYHAYRQGRLGKSKRQPAVNRLFLARFCASFSMVAMMCLFLIGVIIDRQPLYIPGVLPQHVQYTTGDRKQQIFYAIPSGASERLEPASNAYRSAALYLLTACICYGYVHNAGWWIKRWWLQHQGRPYRDIPDVYSDIGDDGDDDDYHDDMRSTVPTFHNGHHADSLPMYGDKKKRAEAFQKNNPLLARTWQTATSTTQRLSLYVSSAWADSQDRRKNKRRFAGAKDV